MKPSHIYAVHPAGFLVQFALEEGDSVGDAVEMLFDREFQPSHGDAWPRTPEGIPVCPKHGAVMKKREKQGDTWYSHAVTDEHGEVLFCRGYHSKNSPGWGVPAARRREEAGQRPAAPAPGQQQQTPTQRQQPPTQQQQPAQRPAQPPPPEEPPMDEVGRQEVERMKLPDYRKLAVEASTEETFDYAAYMALRNGLYTDVERIKAVRLALVVGWKPSAKSNAAMLKALEVYRDKRAEAEGRGEATADASKFAKREAMNVYNKEIGG